MSNGQADAMQRAIQAAEDKLLAVGWVSLSDNDQRLVLEGRRLTKQSAILEAITSLPDRIAERNKALAAQYCPYLEGEVPHKSRSKRRRIGVLALSIPVGAGFIAWAVEQIGKLFK